MTDYAPRFHTKATALALAAALAIGGCTNIKDDATRTKTEGALAGTGIGAAIGAGIGALIGGGRGAAIGAAIGAGIGSISGFFVGKHVADKKAEYASREDWLDACLERSKQMTAESRKINEELRAEVSALDKETRRLAANKKGNASALADRKEQVDDLRKETKENIDMLNSEIQKQNSVLADARKGGNKAEAKALNAEISKLKKEVKAMKEYNRKLANISARVAV
ncbi:MAG: hypothetical protein K6A65_05650 [Succinivibrionaceae bacterium]|nr:hypothetical protein [Succinivibrionaceae bacterium]